ncbi:DUF1800 family protein [bacterium]|nr:DUF1800 family protein [Akkermansiaceae bacterium]MDB4266137.1 DUF1800 family protein [bacterium]MDA7674958.1 DUF1800 family protein [Akkermansiaceae bacterium]MDB4301369.1 DUF1800 family protein [Akkermansiaceae bacterium]MDB4305250.1 DUF1800 family protein [Akkermansiaceae bacterium]
MRDQRIERYCLLSESFICYSTDSFSTFQPMGYLRTFSLLSFSILSPLSAVDTNADGLSDVWQQRFAAANLLPLMDEDGDGHLNKAESLAGTDPFSSSSYPEQSPVWAELGGSPLHLSFDSLLGKFYQVTESSDLENYTPLGEPLRGNGAMINLELWANTRSTQTLAQHELWANISGNDLSTLTGLATFPAEPAGASSLDRFEVSPVQAAGFGGRLRALITPAQSGDFTFHVSSASAADLLLSSDATEENLASQATVLSAQTGVLPNVWDAFPNQTSAPISLVAGTPYLLELRYLASSPLSHSQAAWSGPGISGIQIIDSSVFVPTPFLATAQAAAPILNRDYDTSTDPLWLSGTSVVAAPVGLTGNGERFTIDPTGGDDLITLPAAATEQLYASWLFQMDTGHNDVNLYFRNSTTSTQEGPRIDFEDSGGTLAAIRPNGITGSQVVVTFGDPYRIEIIASMTPGGFSYQADLATLTVAEDTFDMFISTPEGKLIGSRLGIPFKDATPNVVQQIDAIRAATVINPNIIFDDWEITGGDISGKGYLASNTSGFVDGGPKQFFRIGASDGDQDADGISDWDEIELAKHSDFLFFDAQTIDGSSDLTRLNTLLAAATGPITVSLQASDTAAFESNSPNLTDDHGEVTITRTGRLTPITVNLCQAPLANTGNTATICDGTCCSLIGSAGDEEAEADDYVITDADGNVITNTVTFGFGEMTKVLTVKATLDTTNEYPETLNLALEADDASSYEISETNGASIQLFDLPEHPDNVALFTGTFSLDGRAAVASNGSGFTTATLNGPRTQLLFWNEFSNLTSAQQDSHIHKSNPGATPGSIIYEITETPGEESLPLNGPLTAYPWDLTDSSGSVPTAGGAASKQTIIDSLFNQSGESPLYLNIHTVDNPDGEIWAFLALSGGSQISPDAPVLSALPGSAEYPQLSGDELESEVRRFLNQATFGATDPQVTALVTEIETERVSDPSYHRHSAFDTWLDDEMNPVATPQTYLLDYNLATDFQYYTLGGAFDPARNPTDGTTATPARPAIWPTVDRSDSDPEKWHLSLAYPISKDELDLIDDNNLVEPSNRNRRQTHWQMMFNAKDQLRQKMGFALQQIVVISAEADTIEDNMYGASNYQDQLNKNAFNHYRDVLSFVNWSPLMGRWLSSLQNQKGADLDGDGNNDIFPDENLAREDMQLFSIGLFERWPDGSLRLGSDGLPIPTYTNDDIREFAKVLTGQSFGQYNSTSDPWGGVAYSALVENTDFDRGQNTDGRLTLRYSYPMKMFGAYHDLSVKTFAGTTIDNTHLTDPTLQGIADIEQALDWLAGKPGDNLPDYEMVNSHRSVPAFICRRLIQRFTTSNPSKDYLHRVATVFKDNEGDLGKTIKAILLDSEARIVDLSNTTFGLKKSSIESYIQILRTMEGLTHIPLTDPAGAAPFDTAPGVFTNPDLFLDTFDLPPTQLANQERNFRFLQDYTITSGTSDLQMVPFRQETVFNWYLPDYSPGGPIAEAGLVSPELQLSNEPDVIRNINFLNTFVRGNFGANSDALSGNNTNQQLALGGGDEVNNNDRIRLDRAGLGISLYPTTANMPTATVERTSESLADEILVDELDRRLTLGYLKRKYPYDPSDDDDPSVPGIDDLLKNPRELIIDAVTAHNDPFGGTNNDIDRMNKLSDALYLIAFSPEFQIKK